MQKHAMQGLKVEKDMNSCFVATAQDERQIKTKELCRNDVIHSGILTYFQQAWLKKFKDGFT